MSLLTRPVRTLGTGRLSIDPAGTAVPLSATPVAISWVIVTARSDNAGKIAVGPSTVLAAAGDDTGAQLSPGQAVTLPIDDLSKVYVDASSSEDAVAFLYGQV